MILIVDDRQENIFSLRTVLEQHGFDTDAALSGEEALKKLLKKDYDLIILDVQMPGMDGFEVAEAITGLNKTKDIPIIFLSAVSTHKRFITKGFETGAIEYLTKPVDADILILKVRNFYRLYEKTQALKEAERALKDTVVQLQTTLESLPGLAFTTDRSGAIEYVNRPWLQYAPTDKAFPATPDNVPTLRTLWLQSIASGDPIELEVPIRNMNDGQFYHHLLRAAPIVVNGFITRWVGTLTSIHDQKMLNETLERKVGERTRELLEMNRELEISNDDLQQFTSVASHDLKEPLRKIQFFGNLLHDRAGLDGDMAAYLGKILNSASRMSKLVTDLLSFASLSQPNLFEITDMDEVMAGIVCDLELSIAEKSAVVEISPVPELEVIPALIRQLFQNLLSNALKFSRDGVRPVITVEATRIGVPDLQSPDTDEGPYCRFRIADNGIGFEEKHAEKIFTIFQRLNPVAAYEGTGIGLAIAKKIVDRHNGLISVTSRPGEGSVFYVILPLRQDALHKSKEQSQFLAIHSS